MIVMFPYPSFGAGIESYRVISSIHLRSRPVKAFAKRSCALKMPRGRKRKEEDHCDSGRDEAAQEEKDESPDRTSSVTKRMKGPKNENLTFKIEHW